MPPTDKWLRLFESDKPAVKARAAKAMLDLGEVPSDLLLEMVDILPNAALDTSLRRALSDASDPNLNSKMKSFLTAELRLATIFRSSVTSRINYVRLVLIPPRRGTIPCTGAGLSSVLALVDLSLPAR